MLNTLFFGDVNIAALFLEHLRQTAACWFRMTIQNVAANSLPPAVGGKILGSSIVHFQNSTIHIT